MNFLPLATVIVQLCALGSWAQEQPPALQPPTRPSEIEALCFERDPELNEWDLVGNGWKIATDPNGGKVLSLHQKESDYQPPYRSPLHLALWKSNVSGNFQLDLEVKSTHPDYGHRDVVVFLGYQGADQFYYVHLAKATDDHANQIFIVNKAARTKISLTTSDGVPWDDHWHHVRVVRDPREGTLAVYFDDMAKPIMTAVDQTFGDGRIGVGSFDDTADFRKVTLRYAGE